MTQRFDSHLPAHALDVLADRFMDAGRRKGIYPKALELLRIVGIQFRRGSRGKGSIRKTNGRAL
jgi:hypothetical protein